MTPEMLDKLSWIQFNTWGTCMLLLFIFCFLVTRKK